MHYALVPEDAEAGAGDWIPVNDQETDIRFSSLKSGKYVLLIRKADGFGTDQYTLKKIYLNIAPLWYETWWAILLFILLLFAVVYMYNFFRLRNVIRKNQKLETLVQHRTNELSRAMSHLEDSREEMSKKIHVLSRLLTSMTHDIQSPLNFVGITSSNISPLIEAGRLPEVEKIGEMIADSSKRMSILLRDMLNYLRINVYGNRLKFEDIRLRPLAEEKLDMFRNMMDVNNTTFINNIPEEIEVNSDLQMVAIMIHNLVDNASKYTRNGTIEIYADIFEDHKVELVVANTDFGIPQHIVDMINAPTMEDKPDSATPTNKAGLGLLIVKEVSIMIGVSLHITQTDQTRFHLVFN